MGTETKDESGAGAGSDHIASCYRTGKGPPVLLAHGLLGSRGFWDPVVSQLRDEFSLIVPDLRGHGEFRASRPFTLWDVAEDLAAILDQEEGERVAVVGFSMGAMAMLRLALKAPHRLSRIVAISSAARVEPVIPRVRNLIMAAMVRAFGPLRGFEPVAQRLMFAEAFRRSQPDVVETAMQVYRSQHGASLGHAIHAVFRRDDVSDAIGKIDLPSLVMVGDLDRNTPPAWSRAIAETIPGSRLEMLPGIGHMAPLEAPEQVGQLLRDFLR